MEDGKGRALCVARRRHLKSVLGLGRVVSHRKGHERRLGPRSDQTTRQSNQAAALILGSDRNA
jgi:hypothetical protein